MSQFLMPSLGADMEAGTLVEKLRNPGDAVARGDIIAAVETQKGVIEIEVFENGILVDWLVDIGTKVDVGAPLAEITNASVARSSASDPPDAVPNAASPEEPLAKAQEQRIPRPENSVAEAWHPDRPGPENKPLAMQQQGTTGIERVRITPAARRLAARENINIAELARSMGRPIYLKDIAAQTPGGDANQLSDMRTAIAAAMSHSKREIPHYYLAHRADLTNAEAFVGQINATRPPQTRLMLGALYLKAIARAVQKYPEFNGHFKDDRYHPADAAHIGLAVSLRSGGLVAPAVLDVDTKNLDDVMTAMRDVIARVRAGRFRARELSNATITLTSLGDRGVDQVYGVIYPPQVAIVGIGTPAMLPCVSIDKVVPRLTACLTLAADHRVSDGRRGALFLNNIIQNLQDPEGL